MICLNSLNTIAVIVSALSSCCIVYLTYWQKRIQKENYKLSLFKEHFYAIDPIVKAYCYFQGGLDTFIKGIIFDDKDSQCPLKGYHIYQTLIENDNSFTAFFPKEQQMYMRFKQDFHSLLSSARIMCNYLPKMQTGNENQTLHSLIYTLSEKDQSITQDSLSAAFPLAKEYIGEFCCNQSEF